MMERDDINLLKGRIHACLGTLFVAQYKALERERAKQPTEHPASIHIHPMVSFTAT